MYEAAGFNPQHYKIIMMITSVRLFQQNQIHPMCTHFILKLLWVSSQIPISYSLKSRYKEGFYQVLKLQSTVRLQLTPLLHQPQEI